MREDQRKSRDEMKSAHWGKRRRRDAIKRRRRRSEEEEGEMKKIE